MNVRIKTIAKWVPAAVTVLAIVFIGLRYKSELFGWFDPMLQASTDATGHGAHSEGSETRDRMADRSDSTRDEIEAGPFTIQVDWSPETPRVGENTIAVKVRDKTGLPLEGAAVALKVDEVVALDEVSPGVYQAEVPVSSEGQLTIPGDIRTVDLRHADFLVSLATGDSSIALTSTTPTESIGSKGEIAYWTCSMHPSVRSDGPGTCPICSMDLTPVTREEIETGVIMVDERRRQLIGVKTDTVRRDNLTKAIRTVGTVMADETRVEDITLKFQAWIGEVDADYTGKSVKKGERLFTFYSPELWSAQEEYIESVRRAQDNPNRSNRLAEVAETRLRLWGLDPSTIASIRERGKPVEYLPYLSPGTGTVMTKNVFEGSAVTAGQLLYRIADLSSLWVEGDIYENELALVETGQTADISLSYRPDQSFVGTVSYIYPYLQPDTRTARIRMEVLNPDGTLKPSMYTNVSLHIPLGERLVVPESAVLYAGEARVAFVDLGEGRLQPRTVTTGVRTDGRIEIVEGLAEGETIVSSAMFLIAAESRLRSGIDKW